jgi:hypothetical protein
MGNLMQDMHLQATIRRFINGALITLIIHGIMHNHSQKEN